jgi:hypothetical protein
VVIIQLDDNIDVVIQPIDIVNIVLDLVSQVRDVVLMNVYLDLGTPGGRDFGMRGI